MKLHIPLQRVRIIVEWSPAQWTVLWFLMGREPDRIRQDHYINGVLEGEWMFHCEYYPITPRTEP